MVWERRQLIHRKGWGFRVSGCRAIREAQTSAEKRVSISPMSLMLDRNGICLDNNRKQDSQLNEGGINTRFRTKRVARKRSCRIRFMLNRMRWGVHADIGVRGGTSWTLERRLFSIFWAMANFHISGRSLLSTASCYRQACQSFVFFQV